MQFLHKLRRRKRDKNAEASATASVLLPALPFNDDKLAESEDKGTQTSNDSGYGSAENASPTFATTPAELSASEEEHSSEKLKFAQLVNLEQDVVNRRRRESIRFELFGTDDDDGEEEEDAQEGASIQSGARPPPRPRLNICTSVAGRRPPPTAITPVSADSPQLQAYRPLPTWHSYNSTSWSTTTCSYFPPRYHTWASQRLLDITHDRIAASRRRSEAFPPGSAADAGHSLLAPPPSSTHAPATLRELRTRAPKDPLRVRLARSVMLVKLRNGLTSDEAGELYFGPASPPIGPAAPIKSPSYSVAASGSAPLSGACPSSTTAPHPLALVLPRLPAWAHRPTYRERCAVTTLDQEGVQDEILRPEEVRQQGARPGNATVSPRVATFVAELAEHERLQSQFTSTVAIDTPTSSRPARAPPPSRVPAQSDNSPVSSLPTRVHHEASVPRGLAGATTSPPAVVEDLLVTSRTVLIPARPSRPVRVRTCDDSSRPSSAGNNNHDNDDDDDDERPLAMLRRTASSSCIPDRRQLDGDLLGAQQVPLPFWLPPLISATATATASRTRSSTAWRPLSYAGSSATSGPRRGVVVAVPRDEVAPPRPLNESDPTDTGLLPPVAPSVVVCTPAKARQFTSKPSPGSLYWPTTTAPKSLSLPAPPERSRQMPIATKRPDVRSRHSSIELHGSFKVIEHDFQFPSKSKRPWTRSLSLRKARSFWHTGPDNRLACTA